MTAKLKNTTVEACSGMTSHLSAGPQAHTISGHHTT